MQNIRFHRLAIVTLIYNLAVILWGALVRATGSGAGCGAHWPTCNGQIIPQAASTATQIEFTHRIMSGLALPLVIALFVWSLRAFPRKHPARLGAGLALLFTITEALVGAGLVLLELVGKNESVDRAIWMAGHLLNTFLLLAAITLTVWWSSRYASHDKAFITHGKGLLPWVFGAVWVGLAVLGATGAITALGDTLFPSGSLAEGLAQDFDSTAHFLIRLRVVHPVIAFLMGAFVVVTARLARARMDEPVVRLLAGAQVGLFILQLVLGVVNVILLAPVWMQLVHLLAADLVWINLVLLTAATLRPEPELQAAEEPILHTQAARGG